jgi:dipeptidyl aminopeptidase/acylaminoacyl peptidase
VAGGPDDAASDGHGAPISPQAVAAARIRSGCRWAPGGGTAAWVERADGRSDVVVVHPGHGPSVATAGLEAGASGGFAWAGADLAVASAAALFVVPAGGGPGRPVAVGAGSAAAPAVSRDGLVAWTDDAADSCVVLVAPLDGSAPPVVASDASYAWDPAWSLDGVSLAWHEWDLPAMPWQESRVVVAEVDAGRVRNRRVVAGGRGAATGQPRFSPDGARLGFLSDRTGWLNLWAANPDGAGAAPLLDEAREHAEPAYEPGRRSWAWSPDGRQVALCRNEDGFGRLVRVDVASGTAAGMGKGWHRWLDWGADGLLALRSGARTPPTVVRVDPADGERRVVAAGPDLAAGRWVEPEVIERDLLFSPPGATRPPLLVMIHGGPTGQALADWNERVALHLDRGWAVLMPNFRGSTGFGRAHADALAGGWGDADVADVAASVERVVSSGRVDAATVVLTGGSAGGLTALLLAARHPELVRALVVRYPVCDLAALDAATHRFESGYTPWLAARAAWAERSPLAHAGAITAPTLVFHGRDDPVVPVAQSEALAAALQAAGTPVDLVVYDGERHGFRRRATIVDEIRRTLAFISRWSPRPGDRPGST